MGVVMNIDYENYPKQSEKERKTENYKDFKQESIGNSDIATLILVGFDKNNGVKAEPLCFGCDGCYKAYIVTDPDAKIGEHYTKVAEFDHWMKIYDDDGKTFDQKASKITVYRSGDFGCIIHIIQ